tara:strand:+ start:440 stop:1276 length:837 start_codon:yes stop_codon:yes gene_type:complete
MEKTKKAPESTKHVAAEKPAITKEAPVSKPVKKRTIKRKEEAYHCEYEIIKGGGIVFMLPQKGVTVYDKEIDSIREIRYCPNEPSIYVDKQSKNALKQSVAFRNGRVFVPKEKPNLRKFLEEHPANKANGGSTFQVVDKRMDAEKELKKEFLVNDAISLVRDRDITDLLPIAMYFGIGIDSQTSEIRFNLLKIAKSKPAELLASLDSPEVTCRASVHQAKEYQILNVKASGVYWFDSNKLIVSVPVGQDPVSTMVRFCLTEKGSSVLSLIEERLDKLG